MSPLRPTLGLRLALWRWATALGTEDGVTAVVLAMSFPQCWGLEAGCTWEVAAMGDGLPWDPVPALPGIVAWGSVATPNAQSHNPLRVPVLLLIRLVGPPLTPPSSIRPVSLPRPFPLPFPFSLTFPQPFRTPGPLVYFSRPRGTWGVTSVPCRHLLPLLPIVRGLLGALRGGAFPR